MENRKTHYNPIIGDKITFLKTCKETNGQSTLCELELIAKAKGVPAHYHNVFTETFTVTEGELTVEINKKKSILKVGDSAIVPLNSLHRFYNETDKPVKATIELKPGHTGFENGIMITYGLARDGKCNKHSLPKDIKHTALLFDMAAGRVPGLLSLAMPILKMIAKKARAKGIEKELIDRYCI